MNNVIFGAGQRAREMKFLLQEEQGLNADYFVVDAEYLVQKEIDDCPVISTQEFLHTFIPEETVIYLGVGMPRMNRIRERLFSGFSPMGYRFGTFISKYAQVYTRDIGEGTTVFAGAQIGPRVRIGFCNHFEMGAVISHDCTIGDFNFFAPSCALCGDIRIGNGNFFGANCTLRNSIEIEDYVLVGAGAYVDHCLCSKTVIVPQRSIVLADKSSDCFIK